MNTTLPVYKKCVDSCMKHAYPFTFMKGYPKAVSITLDMCRERCARDYLSKQVKRTARALHKS